MKSIKFNCAFAQRPDFFDRVYGREILAEVALRANVLGDVIDLTELTARRDDLRRADFVFTGWGAPPFTDLLRLCPNLKVIFFAGGSTGYLLDPRIWERGIAVSSSYAANAVPVAEYSLAAIIMGLKGGWRAMMDFKMARQYVRRTDVPGAFGATVGLVSCGAIARELLRLLRGFDLRTLVYDPFTADDEIRALGGEPAGLDEIFAQSDVISLHSPELEETRGMITRRHFDVMKRGATFINTARGSIVNEPDLYKSATQRPDLQFVLDVVHPEPPPADSPLFDLPNVIVTPHIAGAMGGECRRMGQYMVEELDRYLSGKPLRWEITPQLAARSIHRPEFMKNPGAMALS